MNCGVLYSKSGCRVQNDAFGHFAAGDKLPEGNQQLAGQCHDHLVWVFLSTAFFSACLFLSLRKVRGAVNRVTSLGSQPCIRSIQSWIGTMMQSYASRVWLQSGGPILLTGIYAMVCYRVATTPDLHGRIRGHPNPTDELWSSVFKIRLQDSD